MQSKIGFITLAALMTVSTVLLGCTAAPQPPTLCEVGLVEELPPHIKKVCFALENSNELTKVLNAYLRNEAQGAAFPVPREEVIPIGPAKRNDVDHVFLRFGRRR